MEQSVIDGYAEDASYLIQSFEAISSTDILSHVLDFIPSPPCRVIEIGAGTGRDAAWLAEQGFDVVAVEPVCEFRQAGKLLHPSPQIKWFNDSLPSISRIIESCEQYELALLIAVWQHIPKENKLTSLRNLHSILSKSGRLILSVRDGPGALKRKCYPTSAEETISLAQQCGFKLIANNSAHSVQKSNQASQVTWTWLVFQSANENSF